MTQTDADFEPRRYRVRHRTHYAYDEPVDACYERGFLGPRQTATQTLVEHTVTVTPEPDLVVEHADWLGNRSFYVEIRTPTTDLDVVKESVLDVAWPRVDLTALDRWTVRSAIADLRRGGVDAVTLATYSLPSALVTAEPVIVAYARKHLDPEQPLGVALDAIMMGVFEDFDFRSGATKVTTTLPDLLDLRAGVCQDFTHLTLACLRSLGLPARYVSGYLETTPAPGRPRLEGADATHAWVSVLTPGGTWVDLDPTNGHLADSRYLVTAWGRDFRDVSPLKGVIYADAPIRSTLTVGVDVLRMTSSNPETSPAPEPS
ncbi:MAG TPA: transglutaminase family protein [Tetrasphaera sp.]|uniref:transglutaminase family protein n=1 Tax=Nostocoides sp. TaxID=1917966 RepID=UPI002BFC4B31|nr:transglutaminase family protein [Tetrasphaera sp.]HNQ06337.1 transglutaminase family protein [Tetrasphaera sp.]